MAENSDYIKLVTFGVSIRGQLDPTKTAEFYQKVSNLVSYIGDLSTSQTATIIFNPENDRDLPIIRPDLDGVKFWAIDIPKEQLKSQLQELGEQLRGARKNLGLSQKLVEQHSGVSQTQISKLEKGHPGQPDPVALYKLASVLGLALDEVMVKAGYEIEVSAIDGD